jgi:hypothetical protein
MTPHVRVAGETWAWFALFVCAAVGTLAVLP